MTRAANVALVSQQSRQAQAMPPLTKPFVAKKPSRGGNLRVGRVVSEVRSNGQGDNETATTATNQTTSLASLRADDERIQHDMVEMLTLKLAKKERELEHLRVQQSAFDEIRERYATEIEQLCVSSNAATSELTSANQQLAQQVQTLQLQLERLRADGDVRNAAAIEVKRLREKEQLAARALDHERVCTIEQLQREVRQSALDRSALETKLVAALAQHQTLSDHITQRDAKNQTLDDALHAERTIREQLEQRLAATVLELEHEQRARASATRDLERMSHEKLALEDKHRQLNKTMKDASARAVDADKRRVERTRSEDALANQFAQLQRENDELRARRSQLSAHAKTQSNRATALERTRDDLQQQLDDARSEIECAHQSSRAQQFRLQQLQEELLFQQKRKRTEAGGAGVGGDAGAVVTSAAVDAPQVFERSDDVASSPSSAPAATDANVGVPRWMKD